MIAILPRVHYDTLSGHDCHQQAQNDSHRDKERQPNDVVANGRYPFSESVKIEQSWSGQRIAVAVRIPQAQENGIERGIHQEYEKE